MLVSLIKCSLNYGNFLKTAFKKLSFVSRVFKYMLRYFCVTVTTAIPGFLKELRK